SDPTATGRGVDCECDFEGPGHVEEVMGEGELQHAPIANNGVRLFWQEGQGLGRGDGGGEEATVELHEMPQGILLIELFIEDQLSNNIVVGYLQLHVSD